METKEINLDKKVLQIQLTEILVEFEEESGFCVRSIDVLRTPVMMDGKTRIISVNINFGL
jgi:hypothetical protein